MVRLINEENRDFLKKEIAISLSLMIIEDMYKKGEITKNTRDSYIRNSNFTKRKEINKKKKVD